MPDNGPKVKGGESHPVGASPRTDIDRQASAARDVAVVPFRVYPSPSLESAGLDEAARLDLLAWLLGLGNGPAAVALEVVDVHFNLDHGLAWLRVQVLGTSCAYVDVVLRLEEIGSTKTPGAADRLALSPNSLQAWGSYVDAYLDDISGARTVAIQLCLLDLAGRICL
jgi:hypothetical protein